MSKMQLRYFCLLLAVVTVSCAKRGTINGGLKDTLAPVLKMSVPKNYTTGFKGNTIKLTFDEYVKLKNIDKQLIVSPPMAKAADVMPLVASKTITIKINDTLQPNTTYSFNFGQSIEDNNEGNPYRQFKYVFSTGPYIDSLALSGTIKDAHDAKTDAFVSVMLYEINEKYNDSVVYKENPRYITNTLDSAKTFKLENLKAGKYLLVALKDANNNFKFDSRNEKIGFHKTYITIPNDTLFDVALFKESVPFKAFKPVQASGNRAFIGYEGDPKGLKVQLRHATENVPFALAKFPKKDSLQLWFPPIKVAAGKTDSLRLSVSRGQYNENFTFKLKNQKNDTLSLTAKQNGILPLAEKLTIASSVPLAKFDLSKMKLVRKDSTAVAFKTEYKDMDQELSFDFTKEPMEKYSLRLFPGAVTDFFEQTNDTLTFGVETSSAADYGNLRLTLENVKQFPVIVELTDKTGVVQYTAYSTGDTTIDFNLIKPQPYTLRIIYDDNKNGEWDPGNFLEKRQSEEVIYFPKEIDVRANWDVVQPFNLKR